MAWSGCIVYLMQAVPVASGIKEMNGNKLKKEEEDDIEEPSLKGTNARQLTLLFLVRSVCREAVYEALNEPRRTTKVGGPPSRSIIGRPCAHRKARVFIGARV